MLLDRIVSMANASVEVDFLAMERSLRATGCRLPIDVIPFDGRIFPLPENSRWWEEPVEWTREVAGDRVRHPLQYRYYLLACGRFQVADVDLVFLRNPQEVLEPFEGLVTACHQWHHPGPAAPQATKDALREFSTCWQARLFNAGQFALGEPLYTPDELARTLLSDAVAPHAFIDEPPWDQGGLNLLAAMRDAPLTHLCLPPHRIQSSWAGDYPGEYERHWAEPGRKPYLMHWAGSQLDEDLPINRLFFDHLTPDEQRRWRQQQRERFARRLRDRRSSLPRIARPLFDLKHAIRGITER